jgi:two-component system response regulator HydG
MREATVILVGRDHSLTETVRELVRSVPNLQLILFPAVDEALCRLDEGDVAVALLHQAPGDGVDAVAYWVRGVAARRRSVATLVISDRHQGLEALSFLRLGVADYLSRPLDLNRLSYLLDVMSLRARYAATDATPAPAPGVVRLETGGEPFLYAASDRMDALMDQVRRVASRDATVLLGGETGTGKTRLARLIHDLSPRAAEPFVVINCGALSATLIESEMFGHVRGAFTGADRDRTGKFTAAGRGTLLLDEVDALPPALQAKLLRAVEDRVFEAVGSNRPQLLQARLVAASNRALDQEVVAGRFRADLYYRLNVVAFTLPPLRERSDVIPELARTFAAGFAGRAGQPAPTLGPDVLRALEAYAWPGNVRELRNAIERAVALCAGPELAPEDLPDPIRPAAGAPAAEARPAAAFGRAGATTLANTKEHAEASRIAEALDRHGNNRLRAAAELGISRMTLYKKLHKYGLMNAV